MKRKLIAFVIMLVFVLSACIPSQEQIDEIVSSAQETALAQVTFVAATSDVDSIVQATFQAMTAQAATTPAPTGSTGGIAGRVNGANHIGVFDVSSDAFYKLDLTEGATSYQIDNIPAGVYYVIAFIDMGQFAAPFPEAYSKFVICGMGNTCTDHTLVPVVVTAGQITQGVDAIDNWGNPDLNPYMEKFYGFDNSPSGTDNIPTFTPEGGLSGTIAGILSYPSEFIPPLAIIAYHVGGGPNDYYFVTTQQNESVYQIPNLPPGQYYVVAYVMGGGLSAGYSQAVPCGLSANCNDHSLIAVNVNGGQVTNNINPQDWYAPDGSFPAYPLP